VPRLPSPSAEERRLLDPDGHFRRRLIADRDAIAGLMADDDVAALVPFVHRLAGAAATFGYAELGALAIAIDEVAAEGHWPLREDLEELLDALDRAAQMSA
jgi:HPt (histidine-containing phosphotransfer) domain-containing protein